MTTRICACYALHLADCRVNKAMETSKVLAPCSLVHSCSLMGVLSVNYAQKGESEIHIQVFIEGLGYYASSRNKSATFPAIFGSFCF